MATFGFIWQHLNLQMATWAEYTLATRQVTNRIQSLNFNFQCPVPQPNAVLVFSGKTINILGTNAMNIVHRRLLWFPMKYNLNFQRQLHYVQGQEPEPKIREYFYYIDHQGMLFLDDSRMKNFTSCFKEKKFLEFFFKRIRLNKTGRYQEFPFISLCGRERNFIRCDDVPIVYTHIVPKGNPEVDFLTFGYAGDLLMAQFQPEKVYMLPQTGRVYHPADEKYGGIGLIRSKLAIEISKNFTFENGENQPPTHFNWKTNNYQLDQFWFSKMLSKHKIKIYSNPES